MRTPVPTLTLLAALAVSYPTQAHAGAVTLVCQYTGNFWVEETPTSFDLDEAAATVLMHEGAYHDPQGSNRSDAQTLGPFAASFGDLEITFLNSVGTKYVINRLTGDVLLYSRGDLAAQRWSCHPATKQF